jgi:hypothetical protein
MSSLRFLKRQLGVYEEYRDSWKRDHDDAIAIYDLEDAISFGVSLYERLKRKPPKDGTTVDMAVALCAYYRDWHGISRDVLHIVETYESRGFTVEGATEFKEMFAELTRMQEAVSEIQETVTALQSGEGVSLDAAIGELQNQGGAQSVHASQPAAHSA